MPSAIWQTLEAGSVRFDSRKDLLPSLRAPDHHHWHGAEMGVGGTRREVQRTGAQGGDADAGLARQPPVSRRHEGSCLFMARDNQLD